VEFDLSPEQRRWRDLAWEFARDEIKPVAEQLDREQKFPYDIVARMSDLGLLGLSLPEDWGGSGGDLISYCLAVEEVARADTSVAITMEAHISLGCSPIANFGTVAQKERFLAPCARGKKLWAFGLTEENAGTDAGGIETTATQTAAGWVVDGTKKYITNSGTEITAGVTVIARTGTRDDGRAELSAFLLPRETLGFSWGEPYVKLGWRAADQHPLRFAGCEIPDDYRLGPRGAGLRQSLQTLDGGRIAVAALSTGLAQACLDEALVHATRRHQFGKSLAEFQAIQFKLADMAMEIELARTMVHKAAWLRDHERPHSREASIAKVFASETAKRAADQAFQIHGGAGFLEASPIARYWRQVKINEIGEGTSEINRQIIAKSVLREVMV
jgi:short-chain 2-methylacyl-CoA dehydrogenase